MCKSKKMIAYLFHPKKKPSKSPSKSSEQPNRSGDSSINPSTIHNFTTGNYSSSTSSSYNYKDSYQSSASSKTSLSSLRQSLSSEHAHVYHFSEICSATNNFLSKRYSSSSTAAAWRCNIRGNDVIVFQRKFRRPIDTSELAERLSLICKSHYTSVIKLRGASISGNYIYLVYDYIQGGSLADCLRNPRNPSFTVLSNWMSRIRIATDLAHGLDYIYHSTGLNLCFVHNHIKSTSIIITEPSLNAKICHFGTAELCGEILEEERVTTPEISKFKRSDSRLMKFEGTRGYMAPEFQFTGVATQKTDVFAFGVVILELLSGEEPLKYRFDDSGGVYTRVSVIETARAAVDGGGGGLRRWMDKRLKDSYPEEVAEKLTRIGLECVGEDPDKRPDMRWIAGRISKLFLESQTWSEKMGVPTDFITALAPR